MLILTYPIAESWEIKREILLHSWDNCAAFCSTSIFTGKITDARKKE